MTTTTPIADTTTEGSKEGGYKEFGWKVLPPDVKALNFYFGFLPREAVEALLKNDGNYAVWGRERNDGALYCYILAVQTKTGKVRHLELKLSGREQHWTVEMMKDAEKYRSTTITELVRALAQTSDGISFTDGSDAVKLGQPVKRPENLFCEHKALSIQNRQLGEGNFCNVVCGRLKSHDGGKKKVAIKAFKEAMPDTPQVQIAKEQKELFMEAKTLSKLHHPNIIEFLGIECSKPPIKMVIEFCPGGSLLKHLQKHTMKISVGERLLYLFEVARGMHYLEQKQVIHRDLAARNCLISIDTTIKIADRTTCRYKSLQPQKIDDFEVEPTVKKSPTSAKSGRIKTVTKQSPDSTRQKTQEPEKTRRGMTAKETSQRSTRDPSPIDPKPKQFDPNGTGRQRVAKPSSDE